MNYKVFESLSNGEIVWNVYDVDTNRFIKSFHNQNNALLVAEIMQKDVKEQEAYQDARFKSIAEGGNK